MTNDGFIEYALDMFSLKGKAHEIFELDKAVERDRDQAELTTEPCWQCGETADEECGVCGGLICSKDSCQSEHICIL